VTAADVVMLARAHLARFAALQGLRPDDRSGAPWPVAIETATLLGSAVRELEAARVRMRQLEQNLAAIEEQRRARRARRTERAAR
jgi:hypothetical protein